MTTTTGTNGTVESNRLNPEYTPEQAAAAAATERAEQRRLEAERDRRHDYTPIIFSKPRKGEPKREKGDLLMGLAMRKAIAIGTDNFGDGKTSFLCVDSDNVLYSVTLSERSPCSAPGMIAKWLETDGNKVTIKAKTVKRLGYAEVQHSGVLSRRAVITFLRAVADAEFARLNGDAG